MTTIQATTVDEILERARAMLPTLRERAVETERLRRLPRDTHEAFAAAGFYKIMQPRAYGGLELEFGTQTALGVELGRACGSSAWVATLLACHAWILGMFPRRAQDDVWGANPEAVIATSFLADRPSIARVERGLRVSGRWRFSSGVDHCDWIVLMTKFEDPAQGGRKAAYYAVVPRADFRIEDVWNSTGLAGTGSNDVLLDNVFIPEHRLLEATGLRGGPTPGSEVNDGYLYRQPLFGTFSFNLIGNVIGIARGASEVVIDALRVRTAMSGAIVGRNQSVQLRVAEALSEIGAAHALVFRNRDEIVRDGRRGHVPDLATRARYRGDNGFAAKLCVAAVDRLIPTLGARGLEAGHPLQRAWRDIHAIAQHIALTWDIQGTLHGTVALGLPCPDPRV